MAKVTSASTRSKRKPAQPKPITQGQNPQRANRQKVASKLVTRSGSSAIGSPTGSGKTTYSDDRGSNTGSAKVTTGRGGGGGTAPKAIPPGKPNGALTTRPNTPPAKPKPKPPVQRGGAIEKAGPTIDVKANTSTLPPGRPSGGGGRGGATTPRPSGGGVPRLPGAVRSGMGGLRAGLLGMVAAPIVDAIGRQAGTALGQALRQSVTPQRTGTSSGRTGRGGTTADRNTSNTNATSGRYVPGSQQTAIPRPRPATTASSTSTPTRSQATQQRATQAPRSSNSGGTVSTPRRATPTSPTMPAVVKERRVSNSTSNRESGNYGTSRTNNPLIDDTMKARMRRREDATGVGPVKDGAQYAGDVKGSTRGVGPVADGDKYSSNIKAKADKLSPEEKKRIKERYS